MFFYLVGIKGAAMSALAKLLMADGHLVKGVDVADHFYTCCGLESVQLDDFSNMRLKPSYFYIIGNAYHHHSVTKFLRNMHYKMLFYPDFLNYYYRLKKWVCNSGSHGKTTTTKLLAHIICDSTALIGDGESQHSFSKTFILEACEYRNTFLNYHPAISLVLNVDYDHPDFFKTEEAYRDSFSKFIQQSQLVVLNGDAVSLRFPNVITYGLNSKNDVVFQYEVKEGQSVIRILNQSFYFPYVGLHLAYDFVGAYLVGKFFGLTDTFIQQRISSFAMPKRRMEQKEINGQVLICDYAHHPTEIQALYSGIKALYPKETIIAVFEPHTLSRLKTFEKKFQEALLLFDRCYLYRLFTSCRETHHQKEENRVYQTLGFELYSEDIEQKLLAEQEGVVCFIGAGIIDQVFEKYVKSKENL